MADHNAHSHDPPHLRCDEVVRQLEAFLDAECAADLERAIRMHLRQCHPCVHRADFGIEVKALIANRCSEGAPAALVGRVLAALRSASSGAGTHPGRMGSAGPSTDHSDKGDII